MLPESISELALFLRQLPGVGKRSGLKLALDILNFSDEDFKKFIDFSREMRKQVRYCDISGVFSDTPISPMISDIKRNQNQICVVHEPTDVLAVENSGIWHGTYHVLFQLINPLENIFVDQTNLAKLFHRIEEAKGVVELVFFLKNSFATDATIAYIKQYLLEKHLLEKTTLTRLAQGLPLHFSTDILDQATMIKAIQDRTKVV